MHDREELKEGRITLNDNTVYAAFGVNNDELTADIFAKTVDPEYRNLFLFVYGVVELSKTQWQEICEIGAEVLDNLDPASIDEKSEFLDQLSAEELELLRSKPKGNA